MRPDGGKEQAAPNRNSQPSTLSSPTVSSSCCMLCHRHTSLLSGMWVSKQQSPILFISEFNQHGLRHLDQTSPVKHFALLRNSQSQFAALNSTASVFEGSVTDLLSFSFFDDAVLQPISHSQSVVTQLVSPWWAATLRLQDLLLMVVVLICAYVCLYVSGTRCAFQQCIVCESRGCDAPVRTHYIKQGVTTTGEKRPKILDV